MTAKRPLFRSYSRQRGLLLLVLPCVLFFIVFQYVPMVGLTIAFKDFVMTEGILRSPWAGLENFRRLFASEDFPRALRNTLTISFLRMAFGFFAPIILALMLNELRLARTAEEIFMLLGQFALVSAEELARVQAERLQRMSYYASSSYARGQTRRQ